MATIAIIGDGPGGLSASLFLGRGGHDVQVYGRDETAMHYAHLRNYLGIAEVHGTDFQEDARAQVQAVGVTLNDATVTEVAAGDDGFTVSTATGSTTADYLILSEGQKSPLAASLGLATNDDGVQVDRNGRSSMDRVYVVGRSARPRRSHAIISAGDGAAAAVDILSTIERKNVQDWDSG
ncbi:MAG: FAD-dependent oxidoreductase [Actinomycetota bacterium]